MSQQDQVPPPRVLVVEDEFLIRLTLTEVLADEGYAVLEAGTGEEAIALLDEEAAIAVLLTDIQLPGSVDGRALVAHARRTRPKLPVIYMTGRADALGERDPAAPELYIGKPYLPSQICAAVRALLARDAPGAP